MNRVAFWLIAGGLVALATPAVGAEVPKPAAAAPSADAAALAARIDQLLAEAWAAKRITPAEPAADTEFLRRVYLDLAGRIPTVAETRAFLADQRTDKRRHLVAGLLHRPTYARHLTTVWRHLLLPEADTNPQIQFVGIGFESWLRGQFDKNAPYDQLVRDLLTTPVDQQTAMRGFNRGATDAPTPIAYYLAKEGKPENLASASARVFLGLRLECAQCHDHPFATWTRDQFWGLAAFYAGIRTQERGEGFFVPDKEVLDRRELSIPGTDRVVQATFPDGTDPEWKFKVGPRQTLAEWLTGKENPYFARAAVNRVWAQLFGIGLVEPVDEMAGGQDTVVHHAQLLDELARVFVAHKFDLKYLLEAIASTRAYQLSSRGRGPAPLFSRHPLRGLTGEQLYDSLAAATGQSDAVADDQFFRFNGGPRQEFLTKFGQQTSRPTEYETSIIQALTLMNGGFVGQATSPGRSELLTAVLEAPFLTDRGRVETIYLATLSRRPTEKEMERAVAFLDKTGTGDDAKKAVADVFWALLNSAEFVFNH
ncbi:MAG: hypothetical protein JWO38_6214 [Gemmataceae bacterium]|nr:hypothetical protein [Gemmataceae bacterium]